MFSKWTALAVAVLVLVLAAGPASAQVTSVLDTPIEKIAGTANGCAVLDKDFPGLRQHPMYSSFKRMTLNQIAAMSKGQITPAMLAQAESDLATPAVATPAAATPAAATP